jgi:hypothetical protein
MPSRSVLFKDTFLKGAPAYLFQIFSRHHRYLLHPLGRNNPPLQPGDPLPTLESIHSSRRGEGGVASRGGPLWSPAVPLVDTGGEFPMQAERSDGLRVGADLSCPPPIYRPSLGYPDVRISYSICIIAPLGVAWPTPDAEHPTLESFNVRSNFVCLSSHALI